MSPNASAAPVCSEQIEQWLNARGVSFKPCRPIDLDEIDHKESRKNQARAEAIDPEHVLRLAAAMRMGDKVPAIVTYKRGSKQVIIDGNHRDEAASKVDGYQLFTYEVAEDTDGATIELLTAEANSKHGKPTDTGWRARQALYLIALGHTGETVSQALGITQVTINRYKRLALGSDRAAKIPIHGFDELSEAVRYALAGISWDPVFEAAVRVAVVYDLTNSEDFKRFMRQLRGSGTEAGALRVVENYAGELKELAKVKKATGKNKHAISNPKMRVLSAFGSIMAITSDDIKRYFLTTEEREEVIRRLSEVAVHVMEMEEDVASG